MASQNSDNFEPWHELNDKVVMVTGASSGLGLEFCLDLAKAGCRIIAAARRVDRLQSLCDEINKQFPFPGSDKPSMDQCRAVALEFDISSSEPIIKARVQEAWDIFGKIDSLINNAGIRERVHGPLDLTEEEWNSVIKTNQTGLWLVSKHVCTHMRDSKNGGSVINISSISGLNRVKYHGAHGYTASKSAVNSLSMAMAMELGSHNIRVNSIAAGIFTSEITGDLTEHEWFWKVVTKIVPLHSKGNLVTGITSLARYLIHDSSIYVTGNVFIVDAGITLPGVPIFSSL